MLKPAGSPATESMNGDRDPSLIRIVKDLRDDTLALVRQEVALAKSEVTGKVSSLGRNSAFLAVGAVAAVFGLFFVLLAVNNLIFTGLAAAGFSGATANWMSPVLLGMALLIAALAFALKAMRSMRKAVRLPEKTVETIREDRDWVKGKFK
jgi:hypothetical protein